MSLPEAQNTPLCSTPSCESELSLT